MKIINTSFNYKENKVLEFTTKKVAILND